MRSPPAINKLSRGFHIQTSSATSVRSHLLQHFPVD